MHDPDIITSLNDDLAREDGVDGLAANLRTLPTVDSLDELCARIDVLSRAAFTPAHPLGEDR